MPAADCGAEEIGETAYCMQPGDKGHYVARIYLIRHGEARASFGEDPDPGLSEAGPTGRRKTPPARYGPSARCRSSARRSPAPAKPRNRSPMPGIRHPRSSRALQRYPPQTCRSPSAHSGSAARCQAAGATCPPHHVAWRDALVAYILGIGRDTLVVSHFVAINAVVGAAVGDDAMLVFRPAQRIRNDCRKRRRAPSGRSTGPQRRFHRELTGPRAAISGRAVRARTRHTTKWRFSPVDRARATNLDRNRGQQSTRNQTLSSGDVAGTIRETHAVNDRAICKAQSSGQPHHDHDGAGGACGRCASCPRSWTRRPPFLSSGSP